MIARRAISPLSGERSGAIRRIAAYVSAHRSHSDDGRQDPNLRPLNGAVMGSIISNQPQIKNNNNKFI